MRSLLFIILIQVFISACDKPIFEKPAKLISRKQMTNMLVDIHLAEATFQNRRYDEQDIVSFRSEDYYYSVLRKYNVADSTFEKSLVYYASVPKDFEKIYAKVLDKLHLLEQQYIEKENQPVDVGNN